ncbi:MAG: R3H domain-containing nucleic acid-binding protein [bacterium]|nr:R3H domain-containing nucleic acid-binding protein [bacterium]
MSSDKIKNLATETAKEVLAYLGFGDSSQISAYNHNDSLVVSIDSEDKMGMLIGKNGQNINALEHVVRVLTYKKIAKELGEAKGSVNFSLDINNYRKLKSDYVAKVAQEAAQRVSQSRRSEALAPMNSYERRLVHTELASFSNIETESVGEEPRRRVVIKPALEI